MACSGRSTKGATTIRSGDIPKGGGESFAVVVSVRKDQVLRKVRSAAMTDIAGLGDAAYTFRDEDGRFKVDVVKCEE